MLCWSRKCLAMKIASNCTSSFDCTLTPNTTAYGAFRFACFISFWQQKFMNRATFKTCILNTQQHIQSLDFCVPPCVKSYKGLRRYNCAYGTFCLHIKTATSLLNAILQQTIDHYPLSKYLWASVSSKSSIFSFPYWSTMYKPHYLHCTRKPSRLQATNPPTMQVASTYTLELKAHFKTKV